MALLELINVNKYYPIGRSDKFHALKDINVQFQRGELVSIIGESGSGKSTLMNLLGGLDTAFEGQILVEGENIGDFNEEALVNYHKTKVGFVFQSFNLIPHLSILDNVALAMTLSNVAPDLRRQRAQTILSLVGLKDHFDKKPNQLSGGQKQRVAIARALVNDPEIIIADEPTGSLDSETSLQVLEIFKEIAASGKLVLLVTHSEKVAAISSRIVEIADGQIIDDRQLSENALKQGKSELSEHLDFEERQANRNLSLLSAIQIALKNMREKLSRNVLISLGGAIGIMSIILMLALGAGVNDYLVDTMNTQVNPTVSEVRMVNDGTTALPGMTLPNNVPSGFAPNPALLQNAPPMQLMQNVPFAEENLEELAALEGVVALEEGFNLFSLSGNSIEAAEQSYPIMNLTTISSMMTEANIALGDFPESGELLISQGLANQLVDELALADIYDILGQEVSLHLYLDGQDLAESLAISGIYQNEGAIGPMALFEGAYLNYADLVVMAAADSIEIQPNIVYLTAEDEAANEDINQQIKDLGYQGSTTASLVATFGQMIDIFTLILVGVAALSLIVSAIMILTVLYISVVERTQEIGVIKAIGGRKKDIRRIFVSESFLLGLFSGLIGVILATVLTFVGNNVIQERFGTTIFSLEPQFALLGVLVSIVISVIAGLLPANAAAQLDPVEALRRE